ncbi:hypothetical protein CHL67_11780 [Prosthecochloris sp. GSB1]|nr:hypothetical protein CHL67_11780 [Prosthecochloris sp. GSB1]
MIWGSFETGWYRKAQEHMAGTTVSTEERGYSFASARRTIFFSSQNPILYNCNSIDHKRIPIVNHTMKGSRS